MVFVSTRRSPHRVTIFRKAARLQPNHLPAVPQKTECPIHQQQILTELGYDPGPIDGQYGRRTAGAVKAFQGDVGLSQDGWIDQTLLNLLTKTKVLNKPPSPRSYNDRSNLSALAQKIESGKAQAKQMEIQIKDMDDRL